MHKKEGGVLYKFVQFDEFIFGGGYYQNTKIQTIYEIGFMPCAKYMKSTLDIRNQPHKSFAKPKRLDKNHLICYNTIVS